MLLLLRRTLGVPFSEVLDEWTPELLFLVLRRLPRAFPVPDSGDTGAIPGGRPGSGEDGEWEDVPLAQFYGSYGLG